MADTSPTLIVGTGLVGSQLARLFIENGQRPVILEVNPRIDALADIFDVNKCQIIQGDVLNPHDLYKTIKSEEIRRIVHTAANPLLTLGALREPYRAVQLNVMGTVNVLEAARTMKLDRVVFTSSNVISHFQTEGPDGKPRPSTVYASTKLACEHLGLNYFDSYGIDFVAVRFSAVIGPWRYGGGGGPTQRFKELLEKTLKGEPASIPGEAQEYLYSKDAAKACYLACEAKSPKRRVYPIGMGKVYSPDEIKQFVQKIIPNAEIDLGGGPAAGVALTRREATDLSSARDELGFKVEYDMEKALKDYVEWLKNR